MEVAFLPLFLVAQAIEALQPTRVGNDLWLNYGSEGWEVFANAWPRARFCPEPVYDRPAVAAALTAGELPPPPLHLLVRREKK